MSKEKAPDPATTPETGDKTLKYIGPPYTNALIYQDKKFDPCNFTAAEQKRFLEKYPEKAGWFK